MRVPIEISARHIHLSKNDLEILFGPDHQLKVKKKLSQKGEFASMETVDLVGPKNTVKNIRVLGPARAKTQIELAMTDSYILGIDVPVRLSGDLTGSAGLMVIGPNGKLDLKEGVIIAKRHLHINTLQAKKLKLKNNSKVKIKIKGERALVLDEVIVRISDNFCLSAHLDTDEANAAGMRKCGFGELIMK